MKNLYVIAICILAVSTALPQQHKPQMLFQPAHWEFERFSLPPEFAPRITYKGAEELRFAPGMFQKDSANYFTYVFVIQLEGVASISQSDIEDYLLNYYRGLCRVTARDRKLSIDTAQINVTIEKQKDLPSGEIVYNATANIFGVFADGAPVKLNIEVQVLMDAPRKRTYLFILASPRDKTDAIWKTLFQYRKEFRLPAPFGSARQDQNKRTHIFEG